MKLSELVGSTKELKRKRNITIAFLITGFLSLLIILITIYGQFAGTFLVTMTKEAHRKGISISETPDFVKEETNLKIKSVNNLEDTLEEVLNISEAENTNGQYFCEGSNYLAYTFYLKNTGVEVVNINYLIVLRGEHKNLSKGTVIKVRESAYDPTNNVPTLISDENYYKQDDNNTITSIDFQNFIPEEIRKYTFFVWLDGNLTDPSMLGGAVKYTWSFSITNAQNTN